VLESSDAGVPDAGESVDCDEPAGTPPVETSQTGTAVTIEGRSADILNGPTGDFKERYGESSKQLHQVLMQNKAVARGAVIEADLYRESQLRLSGARTGSSTPA
jgi:hypothetical protein